MCITDLSKLIDRLVSYHYSVVKVLFVPRVFPLQGRNTDVFHSCAFPGNIGVILLSGPDFQAILYSVVSDLPSQSDLNCALGILIVRVYQGAVKLLTKIAAGRPADNVLDYTCYPCLVKVFSDFRIAFYLLSSPSFNGSWC